jgi:hypothetical protein
MYGLAGTELLAKRLGCDFEVDPDEAFPFFELFTRNDFNGIKFDRSRFVGLIQKRIVIFNLIDGNLSLSKLSQLETWVKNSDHELAFLAINNINFDLLEFCGVADVSSEQILRDFFLRHLDSQNAIHALHLSRYHNLLKSVRSVGIHIRTGIFVNGPELDLPEEVDWLSRIGRYQPLLENAELVYVAADSESARESTASRISDFVPTISLPVSARHLDRGRIRATDKFVTDTLPKEWGKSIFGDWLNLSCCDIVIGSAGRYAKTASILGGSRFYNL